MRLSTLDITNVIKISQTQFFFSGTSTIFFFEADFSSKNCTRCATIWPEQYCVTAGNFLQPLFLLILKWKILFHVDRWKIQNYFAAYVQQVWIWWKTESYFCGRGICASSFKHKGISKRSYNSQVSLFSLCWTTFLWLNIIDQLGALSSPFFKLFSLFTCRFVHVGSAGVTRPERPGLDLSKQPPAVRLNKELDFILTFKLKVHPNPMLSI